MSKLAKNIGTRVDVPTYNKFAELCVSRGAKPAEVNRMLINDFIEGNGKFSNGGVATIIDNQEVDKETMKLLKGLGLTTGATLLAYKFIQWLGKEYDWDADRIDVTAGAVATSVAIVGTGITLASAK